MDLFIECVSNIDTTDVQCPGDWEESGTASPQKTDPDIVIVFGDNSEVRNGKRSEISDNIGVFNQ